MIFLNANGCKSITYLSIFLRSKSYHSLICVAGCCTVSQIVANFLTPPVLSLKIIV